MKYKDYEVTIRVHLCEDCEREVQNLDGNGVFKIDYKGDYYCPDCALKNGLIDANEWADSYIHHYSVHHASYHNGIVNIYQKWGKSFRKADSIDLLKSIELGKQHNCTYHVGVGEEIK